jgi:hypothetical protein
VLDFVQRRRKTASDKPLLSTPRRFRKRNSPTENSSAFFTAWIHRQVAAKGCKRGDHGSRVDGSWVKR